MARGSDTSAAVGAVGRTNVWAVPPEDLVVIDDPEHPLHDPDRSDGPGPEFVADLVENGVLQPVVGEKVDGRILVIDGRQRVIGARSANFERQRLGRDPIAVEVRTRDGRLLTDLERVGMMISMNEQRRPTTPMSRARMFERLLGFGLAEAREEALSAGLPFDERAEVDRIVWVAEVRFGVTRETLRNWRRMLGCVPEVQAAYDAGEVPALVARKLSHLEAPQQLAELAEMRATGTTKGTEGVRAARKAAGKTAKPGAAGDRRRKEPMKGRRYLERALEAATVKGKTGAAQAVAEVLRWRRGAPDRPGRGRGGRDQGPAQGGGGMSATNEETVNLVVHAAYADVGRRSYRWTGTLEVRVGDVVEVDSRTHGRTRAVVVGVGLPREGEWPADIKSAGTWLYRGIERLVNLADSVAQGMPVDAHALADLVRLLRPVLDQLSRR